ncbi:MAG: Xaa-Pro peptidase family protein [Candidatus Omnitrophota bacterium]|jgi:Xaa-Pro aminopeptidase
MPLKRIKARISRIGMDALLVSDKSDIIYLTNFYSQGVMVLVGRGKPLYVIDPMNKALAEKMLKGKKLEVVEAKGSIIDTVADLVRDKRIRKLGYNSESLASSAYEKLIRLKPKVRLKPASFVIREIREIKTPEEIRKLRKAAREAVRIWREVKRSVKAGLTEMEIAALIDVHIRRRGGENSFPTIAAIGSNSAYPHAVPMGRRLKNNEHLLVDFGIKLNGYCSDLTRIWAKGRINRKIQELQKHVRKVHDLTIKKIKPGTSIEALVNGSDRYFKNYSLSKYICHGLGHGLGLDVHEAPFLGSGSRERLKEGMVVTVEPGLYIPGVGGVRIEDMVVVTKKGCEVLTR